MQTGFGHRLSLVRALVLGVGLWAGLAGAQGLSAGSGRLAAAPSPLASKALLTDSAWAGDRIVAVGAHGNIVYSDDRGRHWQQADHVPTQVLLTAVAFADDRHGWAAGHDTLVLHTRDGGATWHIVHEDPIPEDDVPKPILDLYFSDRNRGIAVGAFSLILTTEDGGESWQMLDTAELHDLLTAAGQEPEPNFNAVAPLGDGFLIAGELGTLVHYRPGTSTGEEDASAWRILESPYGGSYFGIDRFSADDLLIYGLRGHCYRSRDSGLSWAEIATGTTANLYDAVQLDNGDLIAVGAGGVILRFPDGEGDVELLPYEGFDGFASVQIAEPGRLLLFGDAGAQSFELP